MVADFSLVEEIIQHTKTGCIFPRGNADQAAAYIELLLTDSDIRGRIVAAAYEQVLTKHSQPSAMVQKFEEIYTHRFSVPCF